jgi:hypothetical protein
MRDLPETSYFSGSERGRGVKKKVIIDMRSLRIAEITYK